MRLSILTIGHSTRSLEEFVAMLHAHGAGCVVDVRTVPRSRTNPQFNRETLPDGLRAAGLEYVHMPELGGLRKTNKDSVNTAWRNASFRGYADYMQTEAFGEAVERLAGMEAQRPALMCAEAVPWRCHRSLIADALTVRGVPVEHIMSKDKRQPHTLTPFARVDGTRIWYPGEPDSESSGAGKEA